MPDVRSEIRDAFARRLARAPMSPDLPVRVAERVTARGRRHLLRLATVVAVLLAVAVVGTLLYVLASRPPQSLSQPATRVMPFVTPSTFPTEMPTLAPTHTP
jgi:hypothetical protein